MTEIIHTPEQTKLATRRTFLTRDLKAISAIIATPLAAQMLFPTSAAARDRDSEFRGGFGGGNNGWGWGGIWGGIWGWGGFWGWGGGHQGPGGHHGDDGHHGDGGHHGGGGGHGGYCFLKGTKILTAAGERKVEDLVAGDLLPTVFGGVQPVRWIGRFRRVRTDPSRPWVKDARPVRIARSALAPEVPHTDLLVTRGHAVLFDDVLIPVGSLINGTTISLYSADEYSELEFFHIKLEAHDVIYAEGAPCETLRKVDETMSNFGDYFRTHGADATPDVPCAPVLCNGPRRELATRVRSLASPLLGSQRFDDIRIALELRAAALV